MSKLLNSKRCGLLSIHGHLSQEDPDNGSRHLRNQPSRNVYIWAVGTALSGLLAFPAANMSTQHISTLTACGNNDSHDPNQPSTSAMASGVPAKKAKRQSRTSSSSSDNSNGSDNLFRVTVVDSLSERSFSNLDDSNSGTLSPASAENRLLRKSLSGLHDRESETPSKTNLPNFNDCERATVSEATSSNDNNCSGARNRMCLTDNQQSHQGFHEKMVKLKRHLDNYAEGGTPSDVTYSLRRNYPKTPISMAEDMAQTFGISLKTAEYFISASVPHAAHRRCLIKRLQQLHHPSRLLPSLYQEMEKKKCEFYSAAIATAVPSLIKQVKETLKDHWGWEPDASAKRAAIDSFYTHNWTTRLLQPQEVKALLKELVDSKTKTLNETKIYGMSVYRKMVQKLNELLTEHERTPLTLIRAENLRLLLLNWNNHLQLGIDTFGISGCTLGYKELIKNDRLTPTKGSPLLWRDKDHWCAVRGPQ